MNSVATRIRVIKGGKGSGNFGHAGRPGKIGGSAPTRREAYEDFKTRIDAGKWRDKKKLGTQGAQADTYYTYVKGGIHCIHKDYSKDGRGRWQGMAHNDEAVYLLAEELGIENVPMTVATDGNNSFQRFANNSEIVIRLDKVDMDEVPEVPLEDIENMMYLDVLTGNWDRHWGNFMLNTKTGRLVFIDNSSTLKDDRNEVWDGMDMTSTWGKDVSMSRVQKIVRESVSYTDALRLPYGGVWPAGNNLALVASQYIKRSNFSAFAKKARSISTWEVITSKFGNTEGNKIYNRMMVRLDAMERYVDYIDTKHDLRQ